MTCGLAHLQSNDWLLSTKVNGHCGILFCSLTNLYRVEFFSETGWFQGSRCCLLSFQRNPWTECAFVFTLTLIFWKCNSGDMESAGLFGLS
eukprot:m.106072 g.106072  ORF g.106072 m.106072 type:complete len:91 (+) comp37249_c0_seq10:350-622(+)